MEIDNEQEIENENKNNIDNENNNIDIDDYENNLKENSEPENI